MTRNRKNPKNWMRWPDGHHSFLQGDADSYRRVRNLQGNAYSTPSQTNLLDFCEYYDCFVKGRILR
jgi:hypothetical protein